MNLVFAIKRLDASAGGAERVFCTVSSMLARRGHNITVITFDERFSSSFYPLDEHIKVINLSVGNTAKPARLLVTLIRIFVLRRTILRLNPDAVVGFMHSIFIPLSFALIGSKIPLIASEHIAFAHYKTRPLQLALFKISSFNIYKITVLSRSVLESYPKLLRDRMCVMKNPVFSVSKQAKPGEFKEIHTLLNVGRLDPQKDHATLIKAFALLLPSFPNWHLNIFGDGLLRQSLELLVVELGISNQVFLLGNTSSISDEYSKSDIFCLSSIYEGMGLVVIEAQAHGLPVVAFADCPGANELISHRKTGLLAVSSENRHHSLANSLSELMLKPNLRIELGSAARLAFSDYPSISDITDCWELLLNPLSSPLH